MVQAPGGTLKASPGCIRLSYRAIPHKTRPQPLASCGCNTPCAVCCGLKRSVPDQLPNAQEELPADMSKRLALGCRCRLQRWASVQGGGATIKALARSSMGLGGQFSQHSLLCGRDSDGCRLTSASILYIAHVSVYQQSTCGRRATVTLSH